MFSVFRLADFVTPLEKRIPIPPWFLPSFLLVGALSTLPSPKFRYIRMTIGGTVMLAMLIKAPKYTSGNVNPDFVSGLFISGIALKFWEFAIYRHSEHEVWRVPSTNTAAAKNGKAVENGKTVANGKVKEKSDDDLKGAEVSVTHGQFDTFWQKLRWSVSLWSTTRGIEWNWGIKDLQQTSPEHMTRLRFIRHSVYRLMFCLISIDFARAIVAWTEWGDPAKVPSLSLYTQPFLPRMIVSWLVGLEIYNGLQVPYYAFATLTVAIGLCRPEQWPPIFGQFSKDAYRVRYFWGKCWHQQLRRSITSPAKAIVTALGIPKGTLLNKYVDLHLAFFFSTLCHVVACYLIGRNEGGMFRLWMGQATIIMLEDYVVYLGKQYGIKENAYTKAIGFVWVIFWMSLNPSLPTGAASALHVGSGYDEPPDFSPSAFFPTRQSSDTLVKVLLDRGVAWFFLARALELIKARTWDEVRRGLEGAAGAAALLICR